MRHSLAAKVKTIPQRVNMFCKPEDLISESDVEQKLIFPMLTSKPPLGLGYNTVDIRTKHDIRRVAIDKGRAEKLYWPDYLIVICGIPIIVVEAKKPEDGCDEGLREGRLYATELNSYFPSGINPCQWVIACNGRMVVCCAADSAEPRCALQLSDIDPSNLGYASFVSLLARTTAQAIADRLRKDLTSRPFFRAVNLLGGQSIRDEDFGYNDLGSKLALDYRRIFKPETRKDRKNIVQKAYVKSVRREHYVDEIDRIIRTAVVSTVPGSTLIDDTSTPREIIEVLRVGAKLENEIMMLVGGRGCGKTTFIDYCREVKLPEDLKKSTLWVHLNLNEAPSDKTLLENWLLQETIEELKRSEPLVDWDAREKIEKLFSVEIKKFKGALSVLNPESEAYKVRYADALIALLNNPNDYVKALTRTLCGEKQRLLVIVFDNCDKRDRDEQLTAFQASRWLQSQIRCLIILPIRDVTYETYKKEPPLDTAIKDLVFRIEPPPFSAILSSRIKLVLNDLRLKSSARILEYMLPNGIRVEYPATEMGYYLSTIFQSLYQYDKLIRSLLLGLAGRDIRTAMEIFLEFCRSGHIGNDQILQIRTSEGRWNLPYHVVVRVLLRRNRRFFDGNASFLANLFQCDPSDAHPDSFARISILSWFRARFNTRGPNQTKVFSRQAPQFPILLLLDMTPDGLN